MSRHDAERWNDRYLRGSAKGPEPSPFLRAHVRELGVGRALTLAMGGGRNAVFLASCGGFEVTGVDVSIRAVASARRLAVQRGVEIRGVVADLEDFELGRRRWELITDFYYLDRALFPRIADALAAGGWFVLETFSVENLQIGDLGPTDPDYLLAPGEIGEYLDGLELVHLEDPVLERRDGKLAALVRVLARKPLG